MEIQLKHSSEIDPWSGDYFYINNPVTMRWKKYKPASVQFKNGINGRFQIHNGYGWENTELMPEEIDGVKAALKTIDSLLSKDDLKQLFVPNDGGSNED